MDAHEIQDRVVIFFTLLLSSVALIIVTFHWFGLFGHGASPECQGTQSRGQVGQTLGEKAYK